MTAPRKLTPAEQQGIDAFAESLTQPMHSFYQGPVDQEINLVEEVRQRLLSYGLGPRLATCFDNNRFVQEAVGKNAHAQQFLLTRWFALQFMLAQDPSQNQRYALLYEVNAKEWLLILDKNILPAFVEFDLPKEI